MKSFVFGKSVKGLPIEAHQFGNEAHPKVLILGGVHGDEIEGVTAALGLYEKFTTKYDFNLSITLVPMFNIDGVLDKRRTNDRKVDLNRNLPSNDWTSEVAQPKYNPGPEANSEPENKALVKYLDANKPVFVLSLHSWKPLLNVNGDCNEEAKAIHKATDYVIEGHIGYPTPGCLGTYCGLERDMPTLTYEIERGLSAGEILNTHVPAILDGLRATERKHKEKVYLANEARR